MSFTRDYERPMYWQDFEELTVGLFREAYGDPNAQKNGRAGQPQAGVDVYGRDRSNRLIGVQCKRLDEHGPDGRILPGGVLTMRVVEEEVANAESFLPSLSEFVIATTAKPDAKVQKQIRVLDRDRRAKGLFSVTSWFWDYYNGWLNNSDQLQQWYYRDILQTRQPETTDRYILDTFHMAFSRNAFRDPIGVEDPQPFLKAIEDTQRALETGELRDRETKAVIRKAPGGISLVSSLKWRDRLTLVKKTVAAVRVCYRDAKSSVPPGLIEHACQVEIRDPSVGRRLDELRADAIRFLNDVLIEADLPPVDSPLI